MPKCEPKSFKQAVLTLTSELDSEILFTAKITETYFFGFREELISIFI